jgi:hypothetical protein
MAAHLRAAVARKLDEVECVRDRQLAGEVGQEDDARLQRADQERLAIGVVARDLRAELGDPRGDLLAREVDLPDSIVAVYEARSSRKCWASRSRSRL